MSFIRRHFPVCSFVAPTTPSRRQHRPALTALLMLISLLSVSATNAAPFAYLGDRVATTVSVVDMATYATIATTPLGSGATSPVNVVVNKATNKIYIGKSSSIAIMDGTSNTLIGDIPLGTAPLLSTFGTESQSLVVANNGKKAYALTPGLVSVIDLMTKSVVATIALPPAASGLALDEDAETLYVSTGNFSATGTPAIVIIDTQINEIDTVVSTGTLVPLHIAMHPDDSHLYIVGFHNDITSNMKYAVLDLVTAKLDEVAITPPAGIPRIGQFNNFVFNADGSRMFLAPQTLDMTTIPVLEINTLNGSVTRVLSIPSGFADEHDFVKMAASFADGNFILAFFIAEHLHHYPSEPPRRVVFVDGISGAIIQQLVFPSPFNNSAIVGDILDVSAVPVTSKTKTTTALRASTNPPLRRNIPITFDAIVTGANPTGSVVFQFTDEQVKFASETQKPTIVKVRHVLVNGTTSLALPACNAHWDNASLRHVVCANKFSVVARYRGDAHNRASRSAVLVETH